MKELLVIIVRPVFIGYYVVMNIILYCCMCELYPSCAKTSVQEFKAPCSTNRGSLYQTENVVKR